MPTLSPPLPRWEIIRIDCDAYDARLQENACCPELMERYDSNFHHLFLALRAARPRLKRITIEGLRLISTDTFYGTDIILDTGQGFLCPPLQEVSRLFGVAGLLHFG